MWQNACLLLWLCSVVAVHGSEVECTKRLDVISPAAWVSLRDIDLNVLNITKLVNVARVQNGYSYVSGIAWHNTDNKTFLRSNSTCFDTGSGTGSRELVELQRRAVKDIQFGTDFVAILAADGTVWTGGCNDYGRLGHHGTENRPVLSQVMGLPPVKKMTVASANVIVVANNGALYSWGHPLALGYKPKSSNNPSPRKIILAQGGVTPKAIDVCCKRVNCAMVTEDLRVFSWGPERYIGRPISEQYIPGLVAGIPEDQRISKVACGHVHTLAVSTSGRLFGWGYNVGGSLVNAEDGLPHATELDMGGKTIRNAAAGKFTSIVATENGDSYYFGMYLGRFWNSPERTADHTVFPRDILATVRSIGPDDEETCGAVSLGCE